MTGVTPDPDGAGASAAAWPEADAGVLGPLPRLDLLQVRFERRLSRGLADRMLLEALGGEGGDPPEVGRPEVMWRASGLGRPGVIAQVSESRLSTRLAVGVETPLAHAIVDRLLGYDRLPGEGRLQVTPVEWGILGYLAARSLSAYPDPGPFTLDRVGPDPFDPAGLGAIVTVRWPVRVGRVAGSVRLWLPEPLVTQALSVPPAAAPGLDGAAVRGRYGDLAGTWHALAGTSHLPRGLSRLRPGGVLPIDGSPLRGTPKDPAGDVTLALADRDGRTEFACRPVARTAAARLTILGPPARTATPREALAVNTPADPNPPVDSPPAAPAPAVASDVPVTLVVELGRVNLPLRRLADLKPGDVVELGRHAREPVELTSNGRLVARGELVQIDTELGVRVTSVFL